MKVTHDIANGLWWDAITYYDIEVSPKGDSDFMNNVGEFLELIGVSESEHFMKNYTTTIYETIYVPWDLDDTDHDPTMKLIILAHELVHVNQFRESPVAFPMRYLADKSWRSQYEAEAMAEELVFTHKLTGETNIDGRVQTLYGYGLEHRHVDYVYDHLSAIVEVLKAGGDLSAGPAGWILEMLGE